MSTYQCCRIFFWYFQQCYHIIHIVWTVCGSSFTHNQYLLSISVSCLAIVLAHKSNLLSPWWHHVTLFLKIYRVFFSWTLLTLTKTYCSTSPMNLKHSHRVSLQCPIIQQYVNTLWHIVPKIDNFMRSCIVDWVYCMLDSSYLRYPSGFLQPPLERYHSQVFLPFLITSLPT